MSSVVQSTEGDGIIVSGSRSGTWRTGTSICDDSCFSWWKCVIWCSVIGWSCYCCDLCNNWCSGVHNKSIHIQCTACITCWVSHRNGAIVVGSICQCVEGYCVVVRGCRGIIWRTRTSIGDGSCLSRRKGVTGCVVVGWSGDCGDLREYRCCYICWSKSIWSCIGTAQGISCQILHTCRNSCFVRSFTW